VGPIWLIDQTIKISVGIKSLPQFLPRYPKLYTPSNLGEIDSLLDESKPRPFTYQEFAPPLELLETGHRVPEGFRVQDLQVHSVPKPLQTSRYTSSRTLPVPAPYPHSTRTQSHPTRTHPHPTRTLSAPYPHPTRTLPAPNRTLPAPYPHPTRTLPAPTRTLPYPHTALTLPAPYLVPNPYTRPYPAP
jgi:hypothetical protein